MAGHKASLAGLPLVMFLTLSSGCAAAAMGPRVYSDLCTESGSGDVAGHRITVTPRAEGYRVKYEFTEGAVMAPVETDDVRYDLKSGKLSFKAKAPSGEVTFEGKAGSESLVGVLADPVATTPSHLSLPRGGPPAGSASCKAQSRH